VSKLAAWRWVNELEDCNCVWVPTTPIHNEVYIVKAFSINRQY
jgi:hypothetical protein